MLFGRFKSQIPAPEEALPGRPEPAYSVPERHTVLDTPLQGPYPEGLETADFGMGCFWGAERVFWQADGVHRPWSATRAAPPPNPSYEEVCSGLRAYGGGTRAYDPAGVLRGAAQALLGGP